jgi:hypothetical protein
MKVTLAALARYAETEPNSGLLNIVGGGIDVFGVEALPMRYKVALALQLRYPDTEAGRTHRLTLACYGVDPQMRIGEETAVDFTPTIGPYHTPGSPGLFAITGPFELTATSAGLHSVRVEIDGVEAYDIPFRVFLIGQGDDEEAEGEG